MSTNYKFIRAHAITIGFDGGGVDAAYIESDRFVRSRAIAAGMTVFSEDSLVWLIEYTLWHTFVFEHTGAEYPAPLPMLLCLNNNSVPHFVSSLGAPIFSGANFGLLGAGRERAAEMANVQAAGGTMRGPGTDEASGRGVLDGLNHHNLEVNEVVRGLVDLFGLNRRHETFGEGIVSAGDGIRSLSEFPHIRQPLRSSLSAGTTYENQLQSYPSPPSNHSNSNHAATTRISRNRGHAEPFTRLENLPPSPAVRIEESYPKLENMYSDELITLVKAEISNEAEE